MPIFQVINKYVFHLQKTIGTNKRQTNA